MQITFTMTKTSSADQAYGRGRDQYRTPATWALHANGIRFATLLGETQRFMQPAWWAVINNDGREVRGGFATRKAAREWAEHNVLELLGLEAA